MNDVKHAILSVSNTIFNAGQSANNDIRYSLDSCLKNGVSIGVYRDIAQSFALVSQVLNFEVLASIDHTIIEKINE